MCEKEEDHPKGIPPNSPTTKEHLSEKVERKQNRAILLICLDFISPTFAYQNSLEWVAIWRNVTGHEFHADFMWCFFRASSNA